MVSIRCNSQPDRPRGGEAFEFIGLTGLQCDWLVEDLPVTFLISRNDGGERLTVIVPQEQRQRILPLQRHRVRGHWIDVEGVVRPVAESVVPLSDEPPI